MTKTSARAIILKDTKILLMYRERNGEKYYVIPGGKVEPNEKPEETVVREVFEETSVVIKPMEYLGCFSYTDKERKHHLFLGEYVSGEPKLGDYIEMEKMRNDPTELYRPEWIELKNVESFVIRPDATTDFLKDYVKQELGRV